MWEETYHRGLSIIVSVSDRTNPVTRRKPAVQGGSRVLSTSSSVLSRWMLNRPRRGEFRGPVLGPKVQPPQGCPGNTSPPRLKQPQSLHPHRPGPRLSWPPRRLNSLLCLTRLLFRPSVPFAWLPLSPPDKLFIVLRISAPLLAVRCDKNVLFSSAFLTGLGKILLPSRLYDRYGPPRILCEHSYSCVQRFCPCDELEARSRGPSESCDRACIYAPCSSP